VNNEQLLARDELEQADEHRLRILPAGVIDDKEGAAFDQVCDLGHFRSSYRRATLARRIAIDASFSENVQPRGEKNISFAEECCIYGTGFSASRIA
jgi:hypothetical protein